MCSILLFDSNRSIVQQESHLINTKFKGIFSKEKRFYSRESLLSYVEDNPDDAQIVVIGLNTPDYNDVFVAKKIKEFRGDAQIIYVSVNSSYNSIIYEIEHVYFLTLPLISKLFIEAVQKALYIIDKEKGRYLVINNKRQTLRICQKQIVYFEKEKRKVHIHLENGEIVTCYMTFEELQNVLAMFFSRCHLSYIININKVKIVESTVVVMENGVNIPLTRGKSSNLRMLCEEFAK